MIHGYTLHLLCLCPSAVNQLLKEIKKIRTSKTYYVIDVECASHNILFQIKDIPYSKELLDQNVTCGRGWAVAPGSDEDAALKILQRIRK